MSGTVRLRKIHREITIGRFQGSLGKGYCHNFKKCVFWEEQTNPSKKICTHLPLGYATHIQINLATTNCNTLELKEFYIRNSWLILFLNIFVLLFQWRTPSKRLRFICLSLNCNSSTLQPIVHSLSLLSFCDYYHHYYFYYCCCCPVVAFIWTIDVI